MQNYTKNVFLKGVSRFFAFSFNLMFSHHIVDFVGPYSDFGCMQVMSACTNKQKKHLGQ